MTNWNEAQDWESDWWADCLNTYNEETKQYLYAAYMGIRIVQQYGVSAFDTGRASVIDIGGGPTSMLLKTQNERQAQRSLVLPGLAIRGRAVVADPCRFPAWVFERYRTAGIEFWSIPGEELPLDQHFDEAWIYNVLQHTKDPAGVLRSALAVADTIRIFEWINTGVNVGHPNTMTKAFLDENLKANGRTVELSGQSSCYGHAYYGTFKAV